MTETFQYPSVEGPVWSISRLFFALDRGIELPSEIHVGGRLQGRCLVSAQGQVALPELIVGAQDGDLVVIEFLYADSARSAVDRLDVRKLKSTKIMVSSLKNGGFVSLKFASLWAQFLLSTRQFFTERGLLEMTTPSLVKNPGMEPELEPFATEWRLGKKKCKLYLLTSPELHLKQLLAQGFTDIFEIKTVFRNEELTPQHQPEFQMLEWYRGFSNLEMIVEDLEAYIAYLSKTVFTSTSERKCRLKKYSVAEIFFQFTEFQLRPTTSIEELYVLAERLKLLPAGQLQFSSKVNSSWNDLFHLIWVAKIAEHLPQEPFLLVDYPPSQAALARLNSHGWADRFEFYWGGVEIANAFHELNDPDEQRRRFERDQKLRIEYGRTPLDIDENFMSALSYGLPPSAGIALGLDRLFMVMSGAKDLLSIHAFAKRTIDGAKMGKLFLDEPE